MDDQNKINLENMGKMVTIKLTFFYMILMWEYFMDGKVMKKMMGFLDFWVVLMSVMKINYCLYCLK